jgi:hypothetical protein
MLGDKLSEFGLTCERVDYSKPLLPPIKDADVLVNGETIRRTQFIVYHFEHVCKCSHSQL